MQAIVDKDTVTIVPENADASSLLELLKTDRAGVVAEWCLEPGKTQNGKDVQVVAIKITFPKHPLEGAAKNPDDVAQRLQDTVDRLRKDAVADGELSKVSG